MKVSFMVASHNRREELLKTLRSCHEQTYPDKEVHVIDDGSSDGTFEAVRTLFPGVILTRNEPAQGSVASRNQIFERVTGDILIGFDDDSRFMEKDSTGKVVERFQQEPDLGLIDFQDIGPEFPERIPESSPARRHGEYHTSSYSSARFALRRKVLEKTGLYPSFFWHAYEEPDLAIRIWDAGYRCLCWNDILVWHEFSNLNRNEQRTHYYHARNEILSTWMRAPLIYVIPLMLWRMNSQLWYSLGRRWWTVECRVWVDAFRMLLMALRNRKAVKTETLRRCLMINRSKVTDPTLVWGLGRQPMHRNLKAPVQH